MKFLHAADLHLDSPLRGLEQYDGAPVDRIRSATRRALENLVQFALDEDVAFVLLAGDLFDGDWRDYKTGLFFVSQMVRLDEAGIKVFFVRGNHDAVNTSMKRLTLPDNVHEFSSRMAETVELTDHGAAIHGRSYRARREGEDLTLHFPDPIDGLLNIGLLHTSLDGRPGHDVYAPCTPDGLMSKGYDYWALGHIHTRETVSGPDGNPWIIFPGNIQGRHVRETGSKGCTLVTVGDGSITGVEHRDLSVVRWAHCTADATGAADADGAVARLLASLEAVVDRSEGLPLAVRCTVSGPCEAHQELVADPLKWLNEVRARAMSLAGGDIWIESVRFGTRSRIDLDAALSADDALGGLLRLISAIEEDDDRLSSLSDEFDDLKKKLPIELFRGDNALHLDDHGLLQDTLIEARDLLVTCLAESGEDL